MREPGGATTEVPAKRDRDSERIGGATLRDHSHNVAARAMQLARAVDSASIRIHDGLFGSEPREKDGGEPKELADNVSADLTDTDRALNVLSDAIMRLEEILQKMGLGQSIGNAAAAPDFDPERPTRDHPPFAERPRAARGERYG